MRLKSVKNIQKITKSMKMVAAAKYAKAERDLKVSGSLLARAFLSNYVENFQGARAYGIGAKAFFENIDPQHEGATKTESQKQLLVLVTSDRGLCGGVHNAISKVGSL